MRKFLLLLLTSIAMHNGCKSISPDLPMGDINVVVLTDVHSWVGGHGRHDSDLDADYGDVLSFWERLKAHCDDNEKDLWLVNNGDFVHGTGISATGDPSSLIPVLEKMPWDAINCGNHELYDEAVVEYMTRPGGMVDFFGERYITSNVHLVKKELGESLPLGNTYRILQGKNSTLLVFGFLYNMGDAACDQIDVRTVEKTVQSVWFKETLKNVATIDGILVLAHMDMKDSLVDVILSALRKHVGDTMPIQFITGHSHYRGVTQLDDWSTSFEAGKYLDTVGFVSFPKKPERDSVEGIGSHSFKSEFINASKAELATRLGIQKEELETEDGGALSTFIYKTREKMGLLKEIGCAPQDYFFAASLHNNQSLWRLYRDEVVPKMFFDRGHEDAVMFLDNGAWRSDIHSCAPIIVDDMITVAPFNDTIVHLGQFPGNVILEMNTTLNIHGSYLKKLPSYILIGPIDDPDQTFDLYVHDFALDGIVKELENLGQTVNLEKTDLTSTLLWLSFVNENWACAGSGALPDWIPTLPQSVANDLGIGEDKRATQTITIIMLVVGSIFALMLLRCMYVALRYIFAGFSPLTGEDMERFRFEGGDMKEIDDESDFIHDIEDFYDDDEEETDEVGL